MLVRAIAGWFEDASGGWEDSSFARLYNPTGAKLSGSTAPFGEEDLCQTFNPPFAAVAGWGGG